MGFEQAGHDLTYVLTSYSGGRMAGGLKEMSLGGPLRTAKVIGKNKEATVSSSILAGAITMDFFFFQSQVLWKPISTLSKMFAEYIGHRESSSTILYWDPF